MHSEQSLGADGRGATPSELPPTVPLDDAPPVAGGAMGSMRSYNRLWAPIFRLDAAGECGPVK